MLHSKKALAPSSAPATPTGCLSRDSCLEPPARCFPWFRGPLPSSPGGQHRWRKHIPSAAAVIKVASPVGRVGARGLSYTCRASPGNRSQVLLPAVTWALKLPHRLHWADCCPAWPWAFLLGVGSPAVGSSLGPSPLCLVLAYWPRKSLNPPWTL